MKIVQAKKSAGSGFEFRSGQQSLREPLVLVFGNRYLLEDAQLYQEVRKLFPDGHLVFGSTAGEIYGEKVFSDTVVLTAIEWERSSFVVQRANLRDHGHNDERLGAHLISLFKKEGLRHLFVISEGSTVNGSGLLASIQDGNVGSFGVSGGLCGDDDRFEVTLCSYNEAPKKGEVIAIGFYGDSLEISCANYGGWTPFGPERKVTKSHKNVLYELDGKSALALYKRYLGPKSEELPKSALLYPLRVTFSDGSPPIVRTVLNINEQESAMILAGDIPEGSKVQLMMATVDDIAHGARMAAKLAVQYREKKTQLALLVSCVGRKLVMDQRTEEEVEEVLKVVGASSHLAGFYSYGEMAPFAGQDACKLHNQTMTLTLLSE